MAYSQLATRRFPLRALTGAGDKFERRRSERRARAALADFRAALVRVLEMHDLGEYPLLGEFVDYTPCLRGFEAMWRIVEKHNGWAAEAVDECRQNVDVKMALRELKLLPVTLEHLVMAFRSKEFEAYRADAEYLRCLAAEKRAHSMLPQVIADTIVREQRYMEGFRRSEALQERLDAANRRALEDGGHLGADENELAAFLEREFDRRNDDGDDR